MTTTLHYAIIRIVPDALRGERVNVGVAVFLGDRIDVRILPSLNKLRALDPRIDMENIYSLEQTLNQLVAPEMGVTEQHALLNHLGMIELTALAWFEIQQASDYERAVTDLMNELVSTRSKPARPRSGTRLETTLRKKFSDSGLLGKDMDAIKKHQIVPKFPIDANDNLYADFALRNGSMHIMETIDFRGSPERIRNDTFRRAALKAITLDRADKVFSGKCSTIVVYAAEPEIADLIQSHISLLSDYTERMYNYLEPSDQEQYLARVFKLAGREQLV